MNKQELIKAIKYKLNVTEIEAENFINTFAVVVSEQVLSGDVVKINGFGRFYLKKSKARKYYNIITNKIVDVDSKESIAFKQFNLGDLCLK